MGIDGNAVEFACDVGINNRVPSVQKGLDDDDGRKEMRNKINIKPRERFRKAIRKVQDGSSR